MSKIAEVSLPGHLAEEDETIHVERVTAGRSEISGKVGLRIQGLGLLTFDVELAEVVAKEMTRQADLIRAFQKKRPQ